MAVEYITNILTTFETDDDTLAGAGGRTTDAASLSALVERLTPRELDVLALLGRRLTNKEIAAELVISPETVKTHTLNIYRKLDVRNRRQAAAKARELGLFSPNIV
jgi:DNA-binding CsgD family transcriptional regulator